MGTERDLEVLNLSTGKTPRYRYTPDEAYWSSKTLASDEVRFEPWKDVPRLAKIESVDFAEMKARNGKSPAVGSEEPDKYVPSTTTSGAAP